MRRYVCSSNRKLPRFVRPKALPDGSPIPPLGSMDGTLAVMVLIRNITLPAAGKFALRGTIEQSAFDHVRNHRLRVANSTPGARGNSRANGADDPPSRSGR